MKVLKEYYMYIINWQFFFIGGAINNCDCWVRIVTEVDVHCLLKWILSVPSKLATKQVMVEDFKSHSLLCVWWKTNQIYKYNYFWSLIGRYQFTVKSRLLTYMLSREISFENWIILFSFILMVLMQFNFTYRFNKIYIVFMLCGWLNRK